MSRTASTLLVVALLGGAAWAWLQWKSEPAVVSRRLDALADEVNAGTTDGSGLAARAAQLSQYFTEDVAIDMGRGTAAINGRATVLDMLSRLQPRTSAFQLRLTDTTVTLGTDGQSATAVLTAQFIRRGGGEDSIDARELSIRLTHADGTWRIAHLTVVDAFR